MYEKSVREVPILNLKNKFKEIRDNYVINQVKKLEIPDFDEDSFRRYRIVFSGRVQKIGFRLEVCELAKRLGLTGFCENLEDGRVLAELQGTANKIMYLISFMESLRRIKIKSKEMVELEVDADEKEFRTRGVVECLGADRA